MVFFIFILFAADHFTRIMWPPTHSHSRSIKEWMTEWLPIVQASVTIVTVLVGGWWTYKLFIEEREQYPHANIEQKLSHVALSEQANLLRVGIELTNVGKTLMRIQESTIRVQQIVPSTPCPNQPVVCAADEVAAALSEVQRQTNQISWPLIAERSFRFPFEIEPGEKQTLDFEFVTPSDAKIVRVYSFFSKDQTSMDGTDVGWTMSGYYDFYPATVGGRK
jgi:hypothetical protein